MAQLVELDADLPFGGTDASVIAIAERLGVTTVATLDRRHIGPIQQMRSICLPKRCEPMTQGLPQSNAAAVVRDISMGR
jgi:hypothetical protein